MDNRQYEQVNEVNYAAEFIDALHMMGCIVDQKQCIKLSKDIWQSSPDKKAISAATSLLAPGVIDKSMHAGVFSLLGLHFREVVSPAAAATLFRLVWSRYGMYTDDNDSIQVMREVIVWLQEKAPETMMTYKERRLLEKLSASTLVSVFRGEPVWKKIDIGITGMSWTLSRDVANHYTYAEGQENGWLISGSVMANDVLAIFLNRKEDEIVLDPRRVSILNVVRGSAGHFPKKYW